MKEGNFDLTFGSFDLQILPLKTVSGNNKFRIKVIIAEGNLLTKIDPAGQSALADDIPGHAEQLVAVTDAIYTDIQQSPTDQFGRGMPGLIGKPDHGIRIGTFDMLDLPCCTLTDPGFDLLGGGIVPGPHSFRDIHALLCSIGKDVFCLLSIHSEGLFAKNGLVMLNAQFHVMCMLGGIIARFILDKTNNGDEAMYETLDNIGDICLALFVSMSIVTMKLWQLIDLALPLVTILMIQLVIIYLFTRFITFNLCGHDYDAAIIAVGHTGFGLGAVPVSMATMTSVCEQYHYSKLAFFVVPLIGGFISNLTNAVAITAFLNIAHGLL